MAAGVRVIITRPERDAQRWVRSLTLQGVDAVALPLIEIGPVSDARALRAAWADLQAYSALMFVSASAVAHFFAAQPESGPAQQDAGPRMWATGPGTSRALAQLGVAASRIDAPDADSGQFDSEALWQRVGATVHAGQRILIVRGSDHDPTLASRLNQARSGNPVHPPGQGRDWLAQRIVQAGAQVDFVVAYWRAPPVLGATQMELATAAAHDGSTWLFTSGEAIGNLLAMLPLCDWSRARALVTHPRIAQAARSAGFGVVWTSRPALSDVAASIKSGR